jgi:hypothetical protein
LGKDTVIVHSTFDRVLYDRVKQMADDNGLSLSSCVRLMLVQHLRNLDQKEPTPAPPEPSYGTHRFYRGY